MPMNNIELCIRYGGDCKRCPRNKKCEREYKQEMDKVTCKYCGIVERGHVCPHKRSRQKSGDRQSEKFRQTKAWTNKSIAVRKRDLYLCAVCMTGKYHTINTFNYDKLSVHHIIPLAEDYNKRLDERNLITLCSYHHKMAEDGEIPREELLDLVEKKYGDRK